MSKSAGKTWQQGGLLSCCAEETLDLPGQGRGGQPPQLVPAPPVADVAPRPREGLALKPVTAEEETGPRPPVPVALRFQEPQRSGEGDAWAGRGSVWGLRGGESGALLGWNVM